MCTNPSRWKSFTVFADRLVTGKPFQWNSLYNRLWPYTRLPSKVECFPANYSLVLQLWNFPTSNNSQYMVCGMWYQSSSSCVYEWAMMTVCHVITIAYYIYDDNYNVRTCKQLGQLEMAVGREQLQWWWRVQLIGNRNIYSKILHFLYQLCLNTYQQQS